MILVEQNQDVYEISFQYNPTVIYMVKSVPGRRWHPDRKIWTIPRDKLGFFLNQIKGTSFEPMLKLVSDENIDVNETIDSTTAIPDIDISDVKFQVKEGSDPFPHQLDFMKWAINRQQKGNKHGFILADEMGLGKTVESVNLALYNKKAYNYKHCLIVVCVNSTKYNWKQDILQHTQGKEDAYILGTRLRKNGLERTDTGNKEKYADLVSGHIYGDKNAKKLPYFIITNIESLRYRENRVYPTANLLIEMINKGEISMVIVDEIHKNASPSSLQGKQLLRIKKNTGTKAMWVPMTGTPITKQPTDVFLPLKLCDGHTFNSYYMWCNEFCIYGGFGGHEIIGYKNIPEMKAWLEVNMIRRRKEDVLQLPPKIHYTEYIENTDYQQRLYERVASEIRNNKDEILMSLNPMTRFLRLRQVNGSPEIVDNSIKLDATYLSKNAKLQRLLELLNEADERGEKTVVFSNWVEPLRTLYRYVSKKYKVCAYTGTMSLADREAHKQRFMEDPEYKVLLGTVGAAGVGQTFTSAQNLIFYDSPWNPSDKEQAEDRIHRIGTTESVNIFTLVTRDTVDDRVEQILSQKSGIAKYIVDGRFDFKKNPELFDYLLGNERKNSQ